MTVADACICGILAGMVAVTELVTRYRDRPLLAICTPGAAFYVFLNAAASVVTYWLLHALNVTLGTDTSRVEIVRVLTASFASLAFFRSNLFLARLGDADIGIGPSVMLIALLTAADRSVDRSRATRRSDEVSSLLQDISFEKACVALPTMCLMMLQNVAADDQERLGLDVTAIRSSEMSDRQKCLALGLKLMSLAGPDVLRGAVSALGDEIKLLHGSPEGAVSAVAVQATH
jgi:hypothetical protein